MCTHLVHAYQSIMCNTVFRFRDQYILKNKQFQVVGSVAKTTMMRYLQQTNVYELIFNLFSFIIIFQCLILQCNILET